MSAIKKMEAVGLKALHGLVVDEREGTALETVYRWRDALRNGKGISDDNKRLLMAATRTLGDEAIVWADFDPALAQADAEGAP